MKFHLDGDPKIKGWTSVATRLLNRGGANAWCIFDDAFRHQQGDFVRLLREELAGHSWMNQLEPARTVEDVKVSDLLKILKNHPITSAQMSESLFESSGQSSYPGEKCPTTQNLEDSPITSSSIRGDRSVFLGRETIHTSDFAGSNPGSSYLLQAVENSVSSHVTSIDFDVALTSIQLAEYPGDGISGYPRHCDQDGGVCRPSQKLRDRPHGETPNSRNRRMVTAIYYLTPEDWDVQEDGGCLRLFSESSEPMQHIAPYRNRLVVFRSDGVEHQVLPSLRRPRLALTIWMYGRLSEPKHLPTAVPKCSSNSNSDGSAPCFDISSKPRHGPPPLSIDEADAKDSAEATIFVSIPAFRDPETGPTIRNLMATARFPSRVFVGLVLQVDTTNSEDDRRRVQDLLPVEQPWFADRVRVLTLDARHATGPCLARVLCQSLFRGEDYVLSIDSHMRFRPNWDSFLIRQIEHLSSLCDSVGRKVVLTTYPVGYQLPNRVPDETRGTLLEPWKFDREGMFRQKARLLTPKEASSGPVRTHLFAAGFNFAHSSLLTDCPYQNLPHLFFGEEISMAIRLFVCGYDLYAPAESVCYHLWHRPSSRSPTTSAGGNSPMLAAKQRQRSKSMAVVQAQLTWNEPHAASSHESVRDVSEFGAAIGVDFSSRTITRKAQH